MQGAARRTERRRDENTVMAYQAASFRGASTVGKLKGLDHYLINKPRAQTSAEMLQVLQSLKANGAAMTIRRVN